MGAAAGYVHLAEKKRRGEKQIPVRPVVVREISKVHAFRPRKVDIDREIASDFLLELSVVRVDARVLIVLVEHPNARESREGPGRHGCDRPQIWVSRQYRGIRSG